MNRDVWNMRLHINGQWLAAVDLDDSLFLEFGGVCLLR